MQKYSIYVDKHTWYVKNLLTEKELSGYYEDLPAEIAKDLYMVINSPSFVCVTSTITIPDSSEFSRWFEKQ